MPPATATTENGDHKTKIIGGVLHKWTNYMTGWQPRYFEICDGTLHYYKSKKEKSAGCRGSIALKAARVQMTDDFNKCEFSIRINDDIVWYLKAESSIIRDRWHQRLIKNTDSDYSSKSHSRTPSVASSNVSVQQLQLLQEQQGQRETVIAERIIELGSYRELCESQMDEIVRELEQIVGETGVVSKHKLLSLKATHIAMLSNVDRILQLAAEHTEMAQVHKPLTSPVSPAPCIQPPKEMPSQKKKVLPSTSSSDDKDVVIKSQPPSTTATVASGFLSDDEEFFDATSERGDAEEATSPNESYTTAPRPPSDHTNSDITPVSSTTDLTTVVEKETERHLPFGCFDSPAFSQSHTLSAEVHRLVKDQLDYALNGASDPTLWTLFASDGEMKMYKREIEQDGLPVDPLKALHSVKGVSALEYMHYFFDAQYKMGWDHTLDAMKVIEKISDDLVVLHQKHKTVWPAAPRESLFWSHLRRVDERRSSGAHDCYIVCNKDIKRADVPLGSSSAVRVGLTVSMICETHIDNPQNLPLSELPRSAFTCKIIYVSSVHPGGWVPTSALRHVYKREYPKFLRTFTTFVVDRVKNQEKVAI